MRRSSSRHLSRDGAVAARLAHNQKVAGSSPAPANRPLRCECESCEEARPGFLDGSGCLILMATGLAFWVAVFFLYLEVRAW